jgi:hypothetical protein
LATTILDETDDQAERRLPFTQSRLHSAWRLGVFLN